MDENTPHEIENCFVVKYECPLLWENLKTVGDNDRIRFCEKCNENVYRVENRTELQIIKQSGKKCVMFEIANMGDLKLIGNSNDLHYLGDL